MKANGVHNLSNLNRTTLHPPVLRHSLVQAPLRARLSSFLVHTTSMCSSLIPRFFRLSTPRPAMVSTVTTTSYIPLSDVPDVPHLDSVPATPASPGARPARTR